MKVARLFILLGLLGFPIYGKTQTHVCGPYYVKQKGIQIGQTFSRNDKMLICGSDEPGWQNVPESQALFHIRAILNAQAYFSPEITRDGERIIIEPGPRSMVEKVIFRNDPPRFKDRVFRGFEDQPMTPAALEEARNWTRSRLRSIGYPCPDVQVRAGYETGVLEVDIQPGPLLKLDRVLRPQTEELKEQVFRRYDAFNVGSLFNADLLALSSRRIIEDDVADFSMFEDRCAPEGAIATQKAILGKPRTLIFAFGASTEEFPIFKTEWKNARIDSYGSSVTLALYASSRLQSLRASSELYWLHDIPPLYFLPSAEVRRESEPTYKAFLQEFQFGLGHRHDDSRYRYILNYSPTYTIERTIEGEGPSRTQYLSFETSFELISHYFEFFRATPQEGHRFKVSWDAQRRGIGSTFSADLLEFMGTALWNLGSFDPPLIVLGIRFGHSVVMTSTLRNVPTSFRLFLGGADDIRGFFRHAINNANTGFQTASYVGLEARSLEILPFNLQPFIFNDFAKVGENNWTWTKTTYLSPGVGIRWQSPLGAFRGTAARGIIVDEDPLQPQPPEEWNFFLSYGREF